MGRRPKSRRPAPAPRPIAPISPESEDIKLASEAAIREQRRKKGRKSTLIMPYADTASRQPGAGKTLLGG